jgi:hypothetical protein
LPVSPRHHSCRRRVFHESIMISAEYGKGGGVAVFRNFRSAFHVGLSKVNSRGILCG